jgi:hypothetical protein
MRELLRFQALSDLVGAPSNSRERRIDRALEELSARGRTMIRGQVLTRESYEELQAVDLARDMRSFRGNSLLIDISTSGRPNPALQRLADHLDSLGGRTTLDLVVEQLKVPFGEHYYSAAGGERLDTRADLDARLAELAGAWARELLGDLAAAPGGGK